MRSRALLLMAAFALPFIATAPIASADEGSPGAPVVASPPLRPPLGVLRHVDAPRASVVPTVPQSRPELVVLVGGYQSCACPDDGTFDALRTRLAIAGGFAVVRFGTDPRFPYDTFGSIDASAANLRDEIRAMSGGYGGVHIVTHSMGGVVADRAFAQGLSRADGVLTYVSWSAPHNGSDAARAVEFVHTVTHADEAPLRESLLWLRMEPDSPAVRDLAHARAPAPPPGVVRLDLREATDVLVSGQDARDPGVDSRTLAGRVEGHGGILDDPEALDLTLATIATRRVPPDTRSRAVQVAAGETSRQVGGLVLFALCLLTCAACVAGLFGRSLFARGLSGALRSFVPRASRKHCP